MLVAIKVGMQAFSFQRDERIQSVGYRGLFVGVYLRTIEESAANFAACFDDFPGQQPRIGFQSCSQVGSLPFVADIGDIAMDVHNKAPAEAEMFSAQVFRT